MRGGGGGREGGRRGKERRAGERERGKGRGRGGGRGEDTTSFREKALVSSPTGKCPMPCPLAKMVLCPKISPIRLAFPCL